MSVEAGKDSFVPDTLKIPPSDGTPIWKLSMELFLNIAERLDSATCLTFSQTCRTLYILSNERSAYWRNASFAHGLLPRIAPMKSFTGAELRSTAVKSINLEWIWENRSPSVAKRIAVPTQLHKERYFVPSGSRWLFQYGTRISKESRIPTILVYDMITEQHIGESRIPVSDKIHRIVGQSLAPDMVVFAVQFVRRPHIAICTAKFHEHDGVPGKQEIETVGNMQTGKDITFCVFQEGLVGITTEDEVVIQQWDNPASQWRLDAEVEWTPRGLQVARNRLLLLERKIDDEPIKSWRIRVFDISVVRDQEAQQISEDETRQLRFIDSANITHAPGEPFYAPYWEDRILESGVHFGFKTLLLIHTEIGEHLWHCDLRLDTEETTDGLTEERLIVVGEYIVGQEPDERPRQFLEGFILGPKASRIVWTTGDGSTRIRSDWTDENASESRELDMHSKPMSIPRLLVFDELFGVIMQSDTSTHHALFYFI